MKLRIAPRGEIARFATLMLMGASIACYPRPYRNGTVPRLFGYDASHVSAFLDKAWPKRDPAKGSYVFETVRKDARGERLYIVPFEPSYSNDPMLVVSLDGTITEKRRPGDWYYLDDELNCAVWVEGPNSLRSRDGGVIRIGEGIDVDPGGDFLWYQLSYTESAVVSLDRSREILCTTDLGVSELFSRSDRLYLSGTEGGWRHRGAGALDIFVKRGKSLVRERRLVLGPLRGVEDLDPLSETALILQRDDLTHVSTWTLMDLETGKPSEN